MTQAVHDLFNLTGKTALVQDQEEMPPKRSITLTQAEPPA